MADNTKIEWTDATWNPITGCSIVSPGCANCYAMKLAGTRLKHIPSREGLTSDTKVGPVWTGEVRFNRQSLDQPLRWKRPRMIFVCAHGDLFAEGVPDFWIDHVFAIMAMADQHIFQVLTKRPARMRDYLLGISKRSHFIAGYGTMVWGGIDDDGHVYEKIEGAVAKPLPNVWFGVSVEDQKRADNRIPLLLDTPATIRWISAEPLLGPISIIDAMWGSDELAVANLTATLDWVVAGGESGPSARPMHPRWAQDLRDQCAAVDVPFLFKQWGNWQVASETNGHLDHSMRTNDAWWIGLDGRRAKPAYADLVDPVAMHRVPKKVAGRHLDGRVHDAFPPLPQHFSLLSRKESP